MISKMKENKVYPSMLLNELSLPQVAGSKAGSPYSADNKETKHYGCFTAYK